MCQGVSGVSGKCVGDGMMLKSVRMARGQQLAPLYYPDTLVNPDTCLGIVYSTTIPNFKMTNEINALFENQNVNFGND